MSNGGRWQLRQVTTQKILDVSSSETGQIGRSVDSFVILRTNKISRQHASLHINAERYLIVTDLKSMNGTFVNGINIGKGRSKKVNPNDTMSFGMCDMSQIENARDAECFFEVILVSDSPVADSTTELSTVKASISSIIIDDSVIEINEISSTIDDDPDESITKAPSRVSRRRKTVDLNGSRSFIAEADDGRMDEKPVNRSVCKETPVIGKTPKSKTPMKNMKEELEKKVKSEKKHDHLSKPKQDDNSFKIPFADGADRSRKSSSKESRKSKTKEYKKSIPPDDEKATDHPAEKNKSKSKRSKSTSKTPIEESKESKPRDRSSCKNKDNSKIDRKSDQTFTQDIDNTIFVDLTDLDDEDELSCSQILLNYDMKDAIKSELEEMDLATGSSEIIDPEDDFDFNNFEAFKSTQDMRDYLMIGLENEPTTSKNQLQEEDIQLEIALPRSKTSYNTEDIAKDKPTRKSLRKKGTVAQQEESEKDRKIVVAPVEEVQDPPRRSLRNKSPAAAQKRKNSVDEAGERKKIKARRSSSINPLSYKPQEVMNELKRRRPSVDNLDRSTRDELKEERRKKLKELAAGRSGCISTNAVPQSVEPQIIRSSLPAPSLSDTNGYHLRRTKSSNEIKLAKKAELLSNQAQAISILAPQSDVVHTSRDPRRHNLPPPIVPAHSMVAQQTQIRSTSNEASRRLMYTNGGPVRRPLTRRLPNIDDITNRMVHWLPLWLLEQINIDVSPPLCKPAPKPIPLRFKNFEEYSDVLIKLILLEQWQHLFRLFREDKTNVKRMNVKHVRVSGEVMMLDCECYITREENQRGQFYRQDDFLMLECIMNDKESGGHYLSVQFALVLNCRKTALSSSDIIMVKLGKHCTGTPEHKLNFTLVTRYLEDKELNTQTFPILKFIANVRGHLMLARALRGLVESPLCPMILAPNMSDYKVTIIHKNMPHPHNLNFQQKNIVLEAASVCTGPKHGIYCVKGPPGTGKSTVIVNLLFQILFSHKGGQQPMILLAAPSNTAVDNLITKLVTAKHALHAGFQHKVKLVRIGPETSISRDVIGYSLPKLAEKHVPLKNIEVPQIKAARDRNENLPEFCKHFYGNQYANELKSCKNLIIQKSNIICTTLNSCINGILMEAVNKGLIQFTCCIIDEATQCHEAEALLPTILGIDRFVLVGDPQQLNATIMNRDAQNLGFGQSLFTRLSNNFGNDPRTPIRMLTHQYRMHQEICSFPNRQFYEGKLKSCFNVNPANKLPDKIHPYLVFNCEKSQSTDYTNRDEVDLIVILLSTICSMVKRSQKLTVGIITPYNAQKELICESTRSLIKSNSNFKINVNTVDSFQGSENDIIIISCVRDSSNSFLQNENRLNVALTRAKQALYIVGNYSLFKECRPLYDLREDAKRRKVLLDIKQNVKTVNFKKLLMKS